MAQQRLAISGIELLRLEYSRVKFMPLRSAMAAARRGTSYQRYRYKITR